MEARVIADGTRGGHRGGDGKRSRKVMWPVKRLEKALSEEGMLVP